MGKNFENPQGRNLDLTVKMYLTPKNCSWAEQILQRPISKYPKNENIFRLCLPSPDVKNCLKELHADFVLLCFLVTMPQYCYTCVQEVQEEPPK